MKTQQEILSRARRINDMEDWLGVERAELCLAMESETYRELNPAIKEEDEELVAKLPVYKTDEDVLDEMHSYLSFAFGKAYGQRGISAGRSIDHFRGLSFLVDDELHRVVTEMTKNNYGPYGLPILRYIDKWLQQRGYEITDVGPDASYY
jgi:hypothetical protein